MEYLKLEQRAEEQRAQIRQDLAELRKQKAALRAAPPQPSWFAERMLALGTWMVSAGERLRKRYQVTHAPRRSMDCKTVG